MGAFIFQLVIKLVISCLPAIILSKIENTFLGITVSLLTGVVITMFFYTATRELKEMNAIAMTAPDGKYGSYSINERAILILANWVGIFIIWIALINVLFDM